MKSGIDTSRLECGIPSPRIRACKRTLPGSEISSGSDPTPTTIKEEWSKMVASGELSLGVPCIPFRLVKFSTKNGELIRQEIQVEGRKFPLSEIRKKLLQKNEKYMRFNTDEEIEKMTLPELHSLVAQFQQNITPNMVDEELWSIIKTYQRTRTLVLWHDHGTILGLGSILMTIHIVYDTATFYTQAEYAQKFSSSENVQSMVERPEIYMFAAGSSSAEDQAALLQDRIDCLPNLSSPIAASTGILIHDKLGFMIGDHPAQQFERGTQQGGTYKCGGCGCKDIMMEDLAHVLHCEWRSLKDLQCIALAGKIGKQPGVIKPFANLRVAQLRDELRTRGVLDDHPKKELQQKLTSILKGVQ